MVFNMGSYLPKSRMNKPIKTPYSIIRDCCAEVAAISSPCSFSQPRSISKSLFSFGPWEGIYTDRFVEVEDFWFTYPDNRMLSPAFMRAMEEGLPGTLQQRYLVLRDEQGTVACLSFQVAEFNALEDIRDTAVWSGWWGKFKRMAARLGNFRLLVLGNMFVVGENGICARNAAARVEVEGELKRLMQIIARKENACVLVAKDFAAPKPGIKGFHALEFQPAMSLDIRPEWVTFEDYLADMSSKYRVRARRALKKAENIRYVPLSLDGVIEYAEELTALYREVVRASGFGLVEAGPAYFISMKRLLGEDFEITACFFGETLCGFYSTLRNGDHLEANFVGFSAEYNRNAQLYLNMLYRIILDGISLGMKKVAFARTALEIKSSVGARPEQAIVYMAHVNPLLNLLLPAGVRFLEPREEWVERHVFHETT